MRRRNQATSAGQIMPPVVQVEATRLIEEIPTDTSLPRLWSAKALAARWGVSRQLFFKLHAAGRLRGFRIRSSSLSGRGSLRFAEEDVMELLQEEQQGNHEESS